MTVLFDPASLAGLDEPVRRYFQHTLRAGAPLATATDLITRGRVKVGVWLPFTARQRQDGRSFEWTARIGWGPLHPLTVTDRFTSGRGTSEGRLLDRWTLFRGQGADVTRSAACRAALESAIWAPASLLPHHGVTWTAQSDHQIIARWKIGPERPRVHLTLDDSGGIRAASALRWGKPPGTAVYGYYRFGADIHTERLFGDLVIPTAISAGWHHGSSRYRPFYAAEVRHFAPGHQPCENTRHQRRQLV